MLKNLLVTVATMALLSGPALAQTIMPETTTMPETTIMPGETMPDSAMPGSPPVTTSQAPYPSSPSVYQAADSSPSSTTYNSYSSDTAGSSNMDRMFYGRLDIGSGVAGDTEFNGSVTGPAGTGSLPFSSDSDLDLGWQAGAALGVTNFPLPNWRTEVEGIYTNNETDDDADNFDDVFDTGDDGEDVDGASADVNVFGGFLNLIYDFNTNSKWRPFLGGGVGYGRVEVDFDGLEGEDEVFLYQGKAGVSYEWSDRTAFEFGYRYLSAESAQFDDSELDLDVTGEVDTKIHSVTAGVRYKFGGSY